MYFHVNFELCFATRKNINIILYTSFVHDFNVNNIALFKFITCLHEFDLFFIFEFLNPHPHTHTPQAPPLIPLK